VTPEELRKVEHMVNKAIRANTPLQEHREVPIAEAKALGAMALFGEKYGDKVRVIQYGKSIELCGGTHVKATGNIGMLRIVSESSVAAGVRRIEAVTGMGVLKLLSDKDAVIADTAKELRANNVSDVVKKAAGVVNELREANKTIDQLNAKIASSMTSGIKDSAVDVGGVTLMTGKMPGAAVDTVRNITDDFKNENDLSVTVIAVPGEGKVNFVASAGKEAVKRGAHAGNLLKQLSAICGGGGGGRPDSAMSGGKQPENVDKALAAAAEILAAMLK
jgi:alanyl-tRNA synthetase